ncbi:TM2 domain-containing protein [Salinibacterium sp. ZJ70]|uniref:TM2 domain-containing protein n=1 Tax=Salinibacterium sp. ZJ70 TaxID=2708084 RepID=UPI001CD70006|nr:TM2 domain-containing protein [Salinibacterium sp. ZJ70]
MTSYPAPPAPSVGLSTTGPKSFLVTWLLALLVGFFGADRFYLGKIGTAILKLITFGGFGVWVLIDVILVLAGAQRDKAGQPLEGYAQHKKIAWIVTAALVALSLVTSMVNGANAGSRPGASDEVASVVAEPVDEPEADEEAPAEEPAEEAGDPTAEWADKAFGSFEPVSQAGSGDNLISLPVGVSAGLVTATHDGSRNFVISVLDANNQSTGDLLVNTIGGYNGTTAWGFNALGDGTTLQITADGAWSITISPISTATRLDGAASGTGDMVLLYSGGASKLATTHSGSRNFVVSEETAKMFSFGLLVNEIGAYDGVVPLSSGPSAITVSADGGWTLAVG